MCRSEYDHEEMLISFAGSCTLPWTGIWRPTVSACTVESPLLCSACSCDLKGTSQSQTTWRVEISCSPMTGAYCVPSGAHAMANNFGPSFIANSLARPTAVFWGEEPSSPRIFWVVIGKLNCVPSKCSPPPLRPKFRVFCICLSLAKQSRCIIVSRGRGRNHLNRATAPLSCDLPRTVITSRTLFPHTRVHQ